MSTQVQYRRGSAIQVAAFTGALGELVIDTTNKIVVVQDGATAGGFSQVGTTAVQTLTNKTLTSPILTTPNIGVATGTSVSVTGNITGSYIFGNGSQLSGIDATQIVSGTSNLKVTTSGGNIAASVGGTSNVAVLATTGIYITGLASVTGTVTGASVVGGVMTGSSVSVTGTVTGASVVGGVMTGSSVSVTGSVSGASVVGGVMTGSSVSVTGSVSGASVAVSGASTAGSYSATGAVTGTTITGTSLTVSTGTITGGNIVNANGNGVGNIGSSTTYFNTVFAKATSAQYADLAEMYTADTSYAPGTVIEFGGNNEITVTTATHSTQIAGIISTQPAYLMNSTQAGNHPLEVALVGRVPCSVVGTIRKGDRLVSSNLPGIAQVLDMNLYQPGCIIGKALEEYNSTEPGVIEVAVGRS